MRRMAVMLLTLVLWSPACGPIKVTHSDPQPEPVTAPEPDGDAVICTMIFVSVQFWVVDAAGNAQQGFELTVTNARTGERYDIEQSDQSGRYTALNDSFRRQVFGDGDPIHVVGRDGWGRTFVADFVIGADRCHIHKVSGPDRIVI